MIGFYDSKVGRKIGHLQEASLDPTLLKSIREGRKIASSLEEPRLSLLRRIMKAEGVSDFNGTLLRSVIRGLVDGSPAEGPGLATSSGSGSRKDKYYGKRDSVSSEPQGRCCPGCICLHVSFR